MARTAIVTGGASRRDRVIGDRLASGGALAWSDRDAERAAFTTSSGGPADTAATLQLMGESEEAAYITGQILGVNGGRNT